MAKRSFHTIKRLLSGLLRPLGVDLGKRLLLTVDDQGIAGMQMRYAVLGSNDAVLSSGECEPASIPKSANTRVSFFSAGAYFEQVEIESQKLNILPFRVRRHITDSLVFKESFRARFAQQRVGPEHYWVDIIAADESVVREVSKALPLQKMAFARMVLVESAIAALVARVTDEPARVFWKHNSELLGLLVEKGQVIGHSVDYLTADMDDEGLTSRLMHLNEAVNSIARRVFTDKEVVLKLELGELAGRRLMLDNGIEISKQLEQRILSTFKHADENHVLQNPELYGLADVAGCYSLLEQPYQQEARVSLYATAFGRVLFACGMVLMIFAANAVYEWRNITAQVTAQNNTLTQAYAELKQQIPSDEQLEVLSRLFSASTSAQFRTDQFLAWISQVTPEGGIIRQLQAAHMHQGSVKAVTSISVQWELSPNYTIAEKQVAGLLVALGKRTQLTNSKLERGNKGGMIFSADISPIHSAFKG